MKTNLLPLKIFLISLILASAINAQIILNVDRKPVIGDSFTTTYMDTTGVVEGPIGSNILWDFSNLTSTGEQWTVVYVHPSEAPNSNLYPEADISVSYDGLAHTFYNTDGNSVHSLGVSYEGFSIVYSNHEKVAEFPFTLSSSFVDSFYASYQIGENLEVRDFGRIKMIGDAYGTIILPDGSTRSALRVKIDREGSDTLAINGIPITINKFRSTTYQWYTNESKYPVLGISYINLLTNGILYNYKQVDYNTETFTNVKDEPNLNVNEFELSQNFPNPFNPSTVINYQISKSSKVTLKVYDIIGNEITTLVNNQQPAGKYTVEFNASNLPSGVYLYRLEAGTFVKTRKMILIK